MKTLSLKFLLAIALFLQAKAFGDVTDSRACLRSRYSLLQQDNLELQHIGFVLEACPQRRLSELVPQILELFQAFERLQKLDSILVQELIVLLAEDGQEPLKSIFELFQSFGIFPKLEPSDKCFFILVLAKNTDHTLLEILESLKPFGMLDGLSLTSLEQILRNLPFEKIIQIEEILKLFPDSFQSTYILVLECSVIMQKMIEVGCEPSTIKNFLKTKTQSGFTIGYFLWQGYVSLNHKEQIKEIYPELGDDLPEGYGLIADDVIYSYYYHKQKPANKIAFVFNGCDSDGLSLRLSGEFGALSTNPGHDLFTKGYNVVAIDTRVVGDEPLKILPHESLELFCAAYDIPLSLDLDLIWLNAHGVFYEMTADGFSEGDGIHLMEAFERNHQPMKAKLVSTVDEVEGLISSFGIYHPVKLVIVSCEGWTAVEGALGVLPNGSEVIAFSKHRTVDGMKLIESMDLTSGVVLEGRLHNHQPEDFEKQGLSAKEIALLHAISIHRDSGPIEDNFFNDAGTGGTLYAKKDQQGLSQYVIFEDEVEKRSEVSFPQEAVDGFISVICSDENCVESYQEEFATLDLPGEPDIRMLPQSTREAFAGYLGLP
jgi:hypothetical protein